MNRYQPDVFGSTQTRKCFHAAMPLTFRMKSVLGSSSGAVGELEQAQAYLLRQAVGLAAVHVLAGQDAILPRRLATA